MCNCNLTSIQIQIYEEGKIVEFFDLFYKDSILSNYSRGKRINDSLHFDVFSYSPIISNSHFTFYQHKYDTSQYQNLFGLDNFKDTILNDPNGFTRNDFISSEREIIHLTTHKIHSDLNDSLKQIKLGFSAYYLVEPNNAVLKYVDLYSNHFSDSLQLYSIGESFFYELKISNLSDDELIELEKEELMSSRLLYTAIINKVLYFRTKKLKYWEAYFEQLKYHRKAIAEDALNYWAVYPE